MEITLSPASEKIVRSKLESGVFVSATDVINAALNLLNEQEKDWSDKIEEGWAQSREGKFVSPEQLSANLIAMKANRRANQEGK
jgi:Arc/MetJ-type ribon-helix-helix transcriptional regulator